MNKVYIGITKGRYQLELFDTVRRGVIKALADQGMYGGGFEWTGARIDWNLNKIVQKFLETKDGTHLFFLETDMKVAPVATLKLLERDKEIVSGLAFHRGQFWPMLMTRFGTKMNEWGNEVEQFLPMRQEVYAFLVRHKLPMADDCWVIDTQDGLVECDAIHTGCLMIKREVFEKIPGPWFTFTESNTQDVAFSMLAQKHGFKIYGDLSVICGHYQEMPTGQCEFRQLYEQGKDIAEDV